MYILKILLILSKKSARTFEAKCMAISGTLHWLVLTEVLVNCGIRS